MDWGNYVAVPGAAWPKLPVMRPVLFALGESRKLAREIAGHAGFDFGEIEERAFEGGEFKLRPVSGVRGHRACVVQSLAGSPGMSPAERLVRLIFVLLALRDHGATHLSAVIPYMAFARKDRRTQPQDPVSSRYVAQLLECAGIGRVIALDAHNIAAFDNAFRIPALHLTAAPLFVDWVASRGVEGSVSVASPDVGGVKRAQLFREALEARLQRPVGFAFIEKRRVLDIVSGSRVVGDVDGSTVVVMDDLCASGSTLIRASKSLREAGARAVHAAFTHAPESRGLDALAREAAIDEIITTDSTAFETPAGQQVAARITVLPVASLIAAAMA